MTEIMERAEWMLAGGLVFGLLFGVLLQLSRFCLLSALSNYLMFRDWRQIHAWLAALVVAIFGVAYLEQAGIADISASSFRVTAITLGGSILGGLVFGIGAVLAGGCASRTLIRASEGNFASLIAMVSFGLAAAATLFGVFAPLRHYAQSGSELGLFAGDNALHAVLGLPPLSLALVVVVMLLLVLAYTGDRRRDWRVLGAGSGIGLLVVAAWWFTGYLAQDEFEPMPPFSLSVSGPLARTSLWITTGTLSASWFGISLVFGMLTGGFLSALASRTYHWVLPEAAHIPHVIAGGLLMGVGAVFAGGCNIGQGLAGLSTLASSSVVTCVAILLGMRLGLALVALDEARRDRLVVAQGRSG